MIIETGSEAYTYTVDVSNRHQVYATADKVNFWIIEQNIACYRLVSACLIRRSWSGRLSAAIPAQLFPGFGTGITSQP